MSDTRKTRITWLGHSAFRLDTPGGKIVLVDPWIQGNPACPEACRRFERLDVLFLTHGHFDHVGDALALAREHKSKVVGAYETCHWLDAKGLAGQTVAMNKGGTVTVEGIRATMVHADHSGGILDGDRIVYGGEAAGYVLELENGYRVYHAGDTAVFGDMKLIGELYRPDVACLPIGDVYTMGPREAALALRLLGVKTVIPMHHSTFDALPGKPAALVELTRDVPGMRVIALKPGEMVVLP